MSPFEVKVKMTPFQTNSKVIFSQSFIKIFDLIRNMDIITGWQILTPFGSEEEDSRGISIKKYHMFIFIMFPIYMYQGCKISCNKKAMMALGAHLSITGTKLFQNLSTGLAEEVV